MNTTPASNKKTWRFEEAVVTLDGAQRPLKTAYEQTLALLSEGTHSSQLSALNSFRSIVEQNSLFSAGHFQVAKLELMVGDRAAALKHATAAVRSSGVHGPVIYYILLIALYCDAGRYDEAVSELDALLDVQADEFPFVEDLPLSPAQDRARFFAERTVGMILPTYLFIAGRLDTRENYIKCFIQNLDDPDQAEIAIAQARNDLIRCPEFDELRFYVVKYLWEQSRFTEAWEALQTGGDDLLPTWPNQVLAGLLCAHNGDSGQAIAHFTNAALENEKLPLFKLEKLNEKGVSEVYAWFAKLIETLPSYAGAYHDGWVYPPLAAVGKLAGSKENEGATYALALADFRETIRNHRGWVALARNDIISRYRRTVLGPLWIVLGTGLALTGMAFVWSMIFGMTMEEFFPYISAGYVTWMFISSMMLEGCNTFSGQAMAIMNNMPMSKTLHVARLVLRNFLIFLHAMIIFVVVATIFDVPVSANTLLVIPGVLLMLLTGAAVALLFGIIGLRYRDFSPALGALMTVLFLVTPIMWHADQLGTRSRYAFLNPLTHFISIVREPLLGQAPMMLSYGVVIAVAIVTWGIAFVAFAKARNRLVFWT